MKDIDFKDKSTPRIFGKGIVIVIVVVFSSISFVLGYFVGKIGREDVNQPARAAETAAVPIESPAPQPRQPIPAETGSSPTDQLQTTPADGRTHLPSQGKTVIPSAKETGREPGQVTTNDAPMPSAKEQPKEAPRQERKDGSKGSRSVEPQPKQSSKEVYTVQLGALKNAAEAKKLRQKFEKKGYKTYLSAAKGKKHEKIYKIRVGEFKERKEAEVLALKLKKTEGLNAFVTVKN